MSTTTTMNSILQPGTAAPDFSLQAKPGESLSLRDFRGRPVVLVFYPADFSPVCGDQVELYNEISDEFAKHDAQLIGISVDSVWCHQAFGKARQLGFPLLADFEPKGAIARRYGVYRDGDGTTERALFVLDADGVIRWSYLSPIAENPGADGILAALEDLQGDEGKKEASRA